VNIGSFLVTLLVIRLEFFVCELVFCFVNRLGAQGLLTLPI